MRILVFSTLYPNAAMPAHGVFVENRLRAFLNLVDADVKVIAPVPWFPFQNETLGAYAAWARAPEKEIRHGVEIFHPRYLLPPKIGMGYAPHAIARAAQKTIAQLADEGWSCDAIDAHYFYPDGVAAAKIAEKLGKPLVITARGTDVNLIPKFSGPRRAIIKAAETANAVISVSDGLKAQLCDLNVPRDKITTLRNGVDLEMFRPADRRQARKALGVSGTVIVSVGHLIDRKGHHLIIDALRDIADATLLIVGDGPRRNNLEAQVKKAGLNERVRFLGALPHEELAPIYSAADILALASSREGWPNVLLEAMACGVPCVATNIPGSNEVIGAPESGRLTERTPEAIAAAINDITADPPQRAQTRAYAKRFSWRHTANGMSAIFTELTTKAATAKSIKTAPITMANHIAHKPRLIVTVDTEEQFDWSQEFNSDHWVNDPSDIEPFQALCAEFGAAPVYFLTYPLLKNAKTARYFRDLHKERAADCGLHLHQWVTPPENGSSGGFNSFQKNLSLKSQQEKLGALADAFEGVFGERAKAHRAGRYGIAPECYAHLTALGVQHDFSPSPAFDFSRSGGPDFSAMSNTPFSAASDHGRVFVTPVSGAKAIRGTSRFLRQQGQAPGFAIETKARPSHAVTPMRLSPEGARLEELKSLTRRLISDGAPILTFTLHSTSLTPGANPYATDASAVENMLEMSRAYFNWFTQEMRGEFVALSDLSGIYEN